MTAEEILAGVDARIAQHRMGTAQIRLQFPPGVAPGAGVPLAIAQQRHAFRFGGGLLYRSQTAAPDPAYLRHFANLFNFGTMLFHWGTSPLYAENFGYEMQEGQPLEQDRREQVAWCRQNGIATKGHALLFQREPEWLWRKPFKDMEKAYENRLRREITTFRGLVDCWDVVNEPTEMKLRAKDNQAWFADRLYATYSPVEIIARAYRIARECDPGATLILNDFILTDAFREIVARSLDAGTPLDAVGLQSHMVQGAWAPDYTWAACERFASLGLPLHFTEVSLRSDSESRAQFNWGRRQESWKTTPEGEEQQAAEAVAFYRLLFSHPAVRAITWWDLSDKSTFAGAAIGLLRGDFSPKPAYHALERLIKQDWMTHWQTALPASGAIDFRGFYGDYDLRTSVGGRAYAGAFSLGPQSPPGVVAMRLQ